MKAIIRLLLCPAVLEVWAMMNVSSYVCPWNINRALYRSLEPQGCFISRINRPESTFASGGAFL